MRVGDVKLVHPIRFNWHDSFRTADIWKWVLVRDRRIFDGNNKKFSSTTTAKIDWLRAVWLRWWSNVEKSIWSDAFKCRRLWHWILLCSWNGVRFTDFIANWFACDVHDMGMVFTTIDWFLSRASSGFIEWQMSNEIWTTTTVYFTLFDWHLTWTFVRSKW